MPKLVTVVGATGIQGGSVVKALVNDEAYIVRGITRHKNSKAAKDLEAQGVEVVEADMNDLFSLREAFKGSYAIFGTTNFFEPFPSISIEDAIQVESRKGINLAKAAAETEGLTHYVWSTLPNSCRVSNGVINVPHYAGKNIVDDYIKSNLALCQKTTFLWITFYASNIQYPFYRPFPVSTAGNGKYIQIQASPASVPISLSGDASVNVGIFVKSVLRQPQKTLPGKFVLAETDRMTAGEMLEAWASAQGKDAAYALVDKAMYYDMWPIWGELMDLSHQYWNLVKEKSFSGEDEILTRNDLGVVGLVDTAAAFAAMKD